MTDPKKFNSAVLAWFERHGRKDLPWQQGLSPFRVWVSEIMLQQTQVATVIPYYQRFMTRFPDLQSLATAPIDAVLHHWSGLGYYARARNLHKTAQMIQHQYQGVFPSSVASLCELPGIGRSTAGAICSIAYQQPAAILDGNVKRVLSRVHAFEGWPGNARVAKQLWEYAETYTPVERTGEYNQAMMDLGATLCLRSKPLCPACPVSQQCKAFQQGNQQDYPGKKPKRKQPVKQVQMLMIQNPRGELLLQHRPPQGIWGGLWSFPELNAEADSLPLVTPERIGDVFLPIQAIAIVGGRIGKLHGAAGRVGP